MPYTPTTFAELQTASQTDPPWLWRGYLAPGEVTLLTSLWKAGKSTLISVLLSRLKDGGEFAGLPLKAGRAVILTEESPAQWAERCRVVSFGDHLTWFCRPFVGKPRYDQWIEFIDQVAQMHVERTIDLFVVDPIANLTPARTENDAAEILNTVAPLQRLTSRGISVLLAHHPRKKPTVPGQAARGSGALSGFADILLEMKRPSIRHHKDRRRIIHGLSRHDVTPPTWVIELNAESSDYLCLGSTTEISYEAGSPVLKSILEQADKPFTRRDILQSWPETGAPPVTQTLWKWLTRASKEGWILRDGSGTKNDPHTYKLPGMDQKWYQAQLDELTNRIMSNTPL
jgi:hypothetical protein